jgi:vacuolar-type H+-ATPase subunit I/STV1
MWRTARMIWVDIFLNRNFVANTIGLLADSQTFEMQSATDGKECGASEIHKTQLHRLQADIRNYQAYLPEAGVAGSVLNQPPDSLDQALPLMEQAIKHWIAHIHPLTERIKTLDAQLLEWRFLVRCLKHIPDQSLSLESFNKTVQHKAFIGIGTASGLFALQAEPSVLLQCYPLSVKKPKPDEADTVFVGIMPENNSAALERSLRVTGAQFAKIPVELSGTPEQALQWLRQNTETQQIQRSSLKDQLAQYSDEDKIALWHGQLQRWIWLSEVLDQAWCDEHFVQICGWVPVQKIEILETVLRDSGSPYLLQQSDADEHGEPPVLLENKPGLNHSNRL